MELELRAREGLVPYAELAPEEPDLTGVVLL
jgi:hypothetical protein